MHEEKGYFGSLASEQKAEKKTLKFAYIANFGHWQIPFNIFLIKEETNKSLCILFEFSMIFLLTVSNLMWLENL